MTSQVILNGNRNMDNWSSTQYKVERCTLEHLKRYGEIYATTFAGEPWNDHWTVENAMVHVGEILESRQAYGLECQMEGQVVGFILGASMLFHYGRTFEINDLAVAPEYQGHGIASLLLESLITDLKKRGIKGFHLITAGEGVLPSFYERHGFKKEQRVILMGREE